MNAATQAEEGRRIPWKGMALFCVAYYLCEWLARFLSVPHLGYINPWLPAGLYFAVLLLAEPRDWAWYIAASCVANVTFDLGGALKPALAVCFWCTDTATAVSAAWLARRLTPGRCTLASFRQYAALLAGGSLGATLGATSGAVAAVTFGLANSYFQVWEGWWCGNAMAISLVTPVILTSIRDVRTRSRRYTDPRTIGEAGLMWSLLLLVLWHILFIERGVMSPTKGTLVLPLLWAGIRFGPREASWMSLVTGLVFAFFTAQVPMGVTHAELISGQAMLVLNSAMVFAAMAAMVPAIILRERMQTLAELRFSEDRFALAARATADGIWDWDVAGGRFFNGARIREMLGCAPEDFPDTFPAFEARLHPEDRGPVLAAMDAHLARRTPYDIELRLQTKSGEYRWFRSRGQAIWDEMGKAVRMAGSLGDITLARKSQDALRESEEKFSKAFGASPNGICITEMESGRLLEVNEAYCKLYGYTREEMVGKSPVELGIFKTAEVRRHFVKLLQDCGSVRDLDLPTCRRDGQPRIVSTSAELIQLGNVPCIVSILHDITERKKTEEELQRREERFRSLIENASDMITALDADGLITFQSPSSRRILGYKPELLAGRNVFDFVHMEDAAKAREALVNAIAAPGKPVSVTVRMQARDGDWRLIDAIGRCLPEESGEKTIILNSRDITESARLEEEFRQAQKMDAIGQLAGGIAHDFNNMLAVIQMQASLMLSTRDLNAETRDELQNIMAAAEKSGNLTRQLLTFSRRNVPRVEKMDLVEVIGAVIKLLRRVLGENITLETRFASALPLIEADPGMMEQVIMNLSINARDAMPRGGRLEVNLDSCTVDAHRAETHHAKPGQYLRIVIADTGTGIPADVLPRIFEPFFTTKKVGEGTGLGLATAFGIAQQHHGWIEVESAIAAGTRFSVYLPALAAASKTAAPAAPTQKARGGDELILLVEDEASVRNLTRLVLDYHGYTVLEAATPQEALELHRKQERPPDLLVTDIIMPGGMNGRELADELYARQPGLKVIYVSGYSNELIDHELRVRQGRGFLQKPFSAFQLASIVRQCLDGALN